MHPIAYAACLSLCLLCRTAGAVGDPAALFGDKTKQQITVPYLAPGSLFSLRLPPNWHAHTFPGRPDFVEIRMAGPNTALLQVQRFPTSEGARPKQLLLRALERRLAKLPHFEESGRRDVSINGLRATAIAGSFWFQGNAEYPRDLEEIFLSVGKDAYELHFECFSPLSTQLANQLDAIYQTFVARPQAGRMAPPPDSDDETNPLDEIPF
jgi:hypothetical protein